MIVTLVLFHFQTFGLSELRDNYEKSYLDSDVTRAQIERLSSKSGTAIETGYLGAHYLLMSSHHWNPVKKLKYFDLGKTYLEEAINRDSDNLELRYLRFINQCKIPTFLGYNDSLNQDRQFVFKHLVSADLDLKKRIVKFMDENLDLTNEEIKILKDAK